MDKYIKSTEEFEDYSIERIFSTDQLSLDIWMVRVSQEIQESGGPILYGIQVGGSILGEPIIHKGVVYVGSCDKNFYAIDLEGKERWRFNTGGVIFDTSLHKDTLYFGSFDGNLYALTLDGKLKWKFACKDKVGSKPLIHNDVIYFGSKDKNFYALSLDGKLKWKFQTTAPLQTRSVATKDRIFFNSLAGGKFYCLDTEGQLRWEFSTGEPCSYPCLHKDIVYVNSLNRLLYSFTLDGKMLWKTTIPAPSSQDPVVNGNRLYIVDYHGNLLCLNLKGKFLWKFVTKSILYSRPLFYDEKIFFGGTDSNFYCLEEKTGRQIWTLSIGGPVVNRAALSGNKIIFSGYDCNVYCVSTEGGLLWKFPTSLSYISQLNIPQKSPEKQTFQIVIPSEEPLQTEDKYKTKKQQDAFSGSVYSGLDIGYTGESVYTSKKKRYG